MTTTTINPAIPPVPTLHIALVGTVFSFVWSSAFIAGKIGMTATGPLTLLCFRFLLAGGLLWVLMRWFAPGVSLRQMDRGAIGLALASGLLTNVVYLGLTYTGMKTVPAGLTAILVSTNPLMTSALASLWLKEPFGWRGTLGLASGFLGVVWIMWGRAAAAPADMTGIALILLGTAALAAATLINRRAVGRANLWGITLIQLFASGLALLPMAWWSEGLAFVPNAAFFGSLFYQTAIVSIGVTVMLLWLIRHGGAARASSFHLLNPAFGTLLAIGFLGEVVSANELLGVVPIVAGLALVLRPGR
ncbi:MAG: DMT family transporter [Rhodocyclaceae bacterium]